MKSSFCTIGFQRNKWGRDRTIEVPPGEILPVIARAGFDGAEIWAPHVADMGEAELDRITEQLRQLGLAVPMLSPDFDFTTSDESAARSMTEAARLIALAGRIGAKAIRVFTGKVGSADATAGQWDRAVRCLQELAERAGPGGVRWALETHGRNLMDTVDSTLELLGRVDRPTVGLIFQPSTFGEDYLEALDRLRGHAFHVHATNRRDGDRALLADGEMDYPRIFAGLREAGFDGFVSIEWMGDDPARTAENEGAYLREALAKHTTPERK